jgi:hypothetical protein
MVLKLKINMKKNIVLICLLVLSIIDGPLAIAKPQKAKTQAQQASSQVSKPSKADAKAAKQKLKDEKEQLKKETKEWEKRKKDMSPLQLKDLIEENHQLRVRNEKLDITIKELQVKLKQTIDGIQNQPNPQNSLQAQGNLAFSDLSELPAGSYTIDKATGKVLIGGVVDERYGVDPETGLPFIKGIIFKVQIGARQDLNLKDVLIDEVHHENLEQEKADGLYKYTIGHFRNYWEADKLKKGLRVMGIQLAWIVPYQDGKRVLLKEVLPTVIEQKDQKVNTSKPVEQKSSLKQ